MKFILILCSLALCSVAEERKFIAITETSKDIKLNFIISGIIEKIVVKEGQLVDKDQLLIKLDDKSELLKIKKLELEARDDSKIKIGKLDLEHKKAEFEKLKALFQEKAISKRDLNKAKFEYESAEVNLNFIIHEHEIKKVELIRAKESLKLYSLMSPIKGIVEKTNISEGETSDQSKEVVRIVRINPLRIEIPIDYSFARKLTINAPVKVKFDDETYDGKITHKSAVGDAASGTILVRVEVSNPNGRPAGESVTVIIESKN